MGHPRKPYRKTANSTSKRTAPVEDPRQNPILAAYGAPESLIEWACALVAVLDNAALNAILCDYRGIAGDEGVAREDREAARIRYDVLLCAAVTLPLTLADTCVTIAAGDFPT